LSKHDELVYWLAMGQISGMGPKRLASLLSLGKSPAAFFRGTQPTSELLSACKQLGISQVPSWDWSKIDQTLHWASQAGCAILTWDSPQYPSILKQVEGSPPILYVKGQINTLSAKQIAIVGSRHPTHEGKDNAYQFAYELCRRGFTITSGLALGVDGAGHEGALRAGGQTIAVLGSGLNQIYPSQHRHLAERIVESGALVSEFPLDAEPKSAHFPRRNRIISGLSQGVLVVECSLKSGSLITAQFALEQGREVFAIPGSIHNPLAKGCHALIRQGAKCVESVEHIFEEFPAPLSKVAPKAHQISLLGVDELPEPAPLGVPQGPLLPFLGSEFLSIDSLIEKSGLTAEEVSSMLIELELQGAVACVPGGYIRLSTGGTL
jgi:DNA processing protein